MTAAYDSDGIWNASKYKNAQFDAAAKGYLASAEIAAQRKLHEEDGRAPAP